MDPIRVGMRLRTEKGFLTVKEILAQHHSGAAFISDHRGRILYVGDSLPGVVWAFSERGFLESVTWDPEDDQPDDRVVGSIE